VAAADAAAPFAPPRASLRERVFGETPSAWLFIAPAVVVILGLSIVPLAWSLLLSFKSSDLVTPTTWIGTANYKALAHDPKFRDAVAHTLIYTALFVPLSIAGGLALAIALNRRIRFIGLYRTLVFVPFVTSAAAQGVLFSFIFDSQFGVANAVLDGVGIGRQGFFQDPGQALYLIVLIGLWAQLGFCTVIYLAALQDIPRELVEAASIDGARRWGVFRAVVWPALLPVSVFLFVWQTFQALQLFDLVYVTTRGGPLESTSVIVFFVYQQAFEFFNAGYAASGAYALAAALLVVGVLAALYRRRREHWA
jgi:multiple sugar transport system permease protein